VTLLFNHDSHFCGYWICIGLHVLAVGLQFGEPKG
jgi:hypothetical protein